MHGNQLTVTLQATMTSLQVNTPPQAHTHTHKQTNHLTKLMEIFTIQTDPLHFNNPAPLPSGSSPEQ